MSQLLKTKITFVVPTALYAELRERVLHDGYGLRGKSVWVSEAIITLLSLENFSMLVQYSEEMQGFEKVETVVVELPVKKQLDQAILEVRKHYPTLEGVQSSIVRTAIMQRLLRT
jgi:hypothetical protein